MNEILDKDHTEYADAAAAWELTHKAQMREAGLHVQTVGEGIAILLQAFKGPNAWNKRLRKRKLTTCRLKRGILGAWIRHIFDYGE